MSENDVTDFRLKHVEETCTKHDAAYEKISEKMTDVEKYNIRQENSQKELTTAIGALTDNLKTVTRVVEEIKDRPLQTHKALIRALWTVAVAVTAFAIENAAMFYASAIAKGMIK